ncbi:F-box protein At2g26160-like [Lotus japonicus]|uniref:F-box protein At2g26160-like n=1 Tax=Lotus japonicus TaxID=34305 RepID=UPI002585FE58|nr:F-box protein At2g26160-like [Lotus japonicus]
MEKGQSVEWLDLPSELWTVIAGHVNKDIITFDIHRFSSVCKTWRYAHPSTHHTLFTPRVYIPLSDDKSFLLQTKIYRLEPLPHQDPSISSSKGWIIMLGESESMPIDLLNPFTRIAIKDDFPNMYESGERVLNLTNFQAVELIEAFTLCSCNSNINRVRKTVLFPGQIVCALDKDGELSVHKIGEKKWSKMDLDYEKTHYHDIMFHMGRLYVMDNLGTVFWMNPSSLELIPFSQSLCLWYGYGYRKHMVESGGSLYVVNRYIPWTYYDGDKADVEVYKLNEECGTWVKVKNLGDLMFILGGDSNFSLSAQEYYGCERNCIYLSQGGKVFSYNLENSELKNPNPFWPCPNLFASKFNL